MHLFLICVFDTWALLLGLYGRYFYIVEKKCLLARVFSVTVLRRVSALWSWSENLTHSTFKIYARATKPILYVSFVRTQEILYFTKCSPPAVQRTLHRVLYMYSAPQPRWREDASLLRSTSSKSAASADSKLSGACSVCGPSFSM